MNKDRHRPESSSVLASDRMRRVRQKGTRKELEIRSGLHQQKLRFRVQLAPVPLSNRRADIVFPVERVAIFVDGCFWHVCPLHRTFPKTNAEWWMAKLEANIRRDRNTDMHLWEAGWAVLRFWEHEDVSLVVQKIAIAVRERRQS